MSNPRYVPRLWARRPSEFGRRLDLEWREPATATERSELDAARRQNGVTLCIRRGLDEQGRTIRWYAEQASCGYDRMTKLLRGDRTGSRCASAAAWTSRGAPSGGTPSRRAVATTA